MSLETDTQVEQVRQVQNENGDLVSPADGEKQKEINDRLGNHDGLTQFVYQTDGTDAEALDAESVPDGVTVLVEYKQGNDGSVYVGDESTQESPLTAVGQSLEFGVTDTSIIHIRTPTAGDGVVVTFEGDA